jgi:phosphomannomutase
MLAEALVDGLTTSGVDVVRVGLGPTPMLYYAEAVLEVDGGIMITGNHNPPSYNGFKMVFQHRPFFGPDIQEIGKLAAEGDWEEAEERGQVTDFDILDQYVERLTAGYQGGAFRVAWDAGNGAAGPALEKLARLLPGEHHLLFTEVDSRFPNHHPDPTEEKNLEHLRAEVRSKGLDFGIAFDGDGDRIGAIDGEGRIIWGDQLLGILAEPVLKAEPGSIIIGDVKASQALYDRVAELGGEPLMWKTGHSHIKSKMRDVGSPLAGEMSGHIFFKHEYYGYGDALYAAVRLLGAVRHSGKSLTQLKSEMPVMVNTPEMRFQVDETRKFAVIDEVLDRLEASGAEVNRTDGARVNTADGWWLLRASNTQDVLVARAEAKDQAGLDRLMAQIDEQLAASGIVRGESVGH